MSKIQKLADIDKHVFARILFSGINCEDSRRSYDSSRQPVYLADAVLESNWGVKVSRTAINADIFTKGEF